MAQSRGNKKNQLLQHMINGTVPEEVFEPDTEEEALLEKLANKAKNGGFGGGSGGNIETIEAVDGILNLRKGNLYANIQNNTTINLPDVTGYTEIRLWFKCDADLTITFPNIAWQNEPESYGGYVYEYIFTYVNGIWVGGFVSYEVV